MPPLLVAIALVVIVSGASAQDCACPQPAKDTPACKAIHFQSLATDQLDRNQLDSAEQSLAEAFRFLEKAGCPERDKILAYKKYAELFYRRGDFERSMTYGLKLSSAAQQAGDAYEQANACTMIAQLFNQMGQADKGILYARRAVAFLDEVDSAAKKADVLFKISKRYLWHYQDFAHVPSLDSFEIFAEQHLALARQLNSDRDLARGYSNLQGVAFERKDYKRAIAYLDSSNFYSQPGDLANIGVNFYDMADLYLLDQDYTRARQFADSAMSVYRRLGNPAFVADTYQLLSRIYKQAGNYQAAYDAFEKADHLSDSLTNIEKATAFNELEKRYNQERNEQKIRELSQRQLIYLLLAATALMIAVFTWLLLRQKNLQQRQTILETEQRLNRARMNPHFFFNALSAVQQYAMQEGDGLKVASSLSQFSHVMRKTLESTYQEMVTIEAEMDFLQRYLSVQQMRFADPFTFSVTASRELDTSEIQVPAMIIQPFVENSIEHGLSGVRDGRIAVKFSEEGNELLITVEDNGRGISAAPAETEHISRATQIVKDRLYLLNLKNKTNARFTVVRQAVGVRVEVFLPFQHA